ncbi:MAG: hypothetical protein HY758_05145 [Nitrospirae bacterium]|nr:hypothetical protein [Nitrospirota bacterium]
MPKNIKKILLIIAASVSILLIALAVFLKLYITPDRVKAFLIPEIEKNLNRKIALGDLRISMFQGIKVRDFAIKEADEKTDFIKCKDFILKYELIPLLSKKLAITELILLSPEINVSRNIDGKYNFEGIGQKPKPEGMKKEIPAGQSRGLPVSLLIEKIIIKDARFSLADSKGELPEMKGAIDIDMGIKSADSSSLLSQGSVALNIEDIALSKSNKHLKNITADLAYEVMFNILSSDINISRADLKVQGIPVSLAGKILNLKTSPEIDIRAAIPTTKLNDLHESLAPFIEIKGLTISGSLTAELNVKGKTREPQSLQIDGLAALKDIGQKYNNINAGLDGTLKFRKQSVDVDFRNTVGENSVDLKGSINNYFKRPEVNLNLYSKQLVLDELIPAGSKSKVISEQGKPILTSPPQEAKPLDLKLSAQGEVRIDSAVYKGITMSNFYAGYILKNNIFEVPKLTATAGKGTLNLNGMADLSKTGYSYSGTVIVDSVHAEELVNSFVPKAKDTVFGVMSANLKMTGAGTTPDVIKKNITAEGDFNVKDGKITDNKISQNLASFLGIDELRTILLKQARGTVKIRNSVAKLDSIFSSDDISMNPAGDIGLDETLNLAFDLRLSPRLSKKAMGSGVVQYIRDDEGWGVIPLKVSGTFSNPSYGVDVAKAGKSIIKKKLLDTLFNKKKDGDQTQDKSPAQDILRGLFK